MSNKAAQLRKLLTDGEKPVVAPGAYDPVSALMVERAGFDAVYMTGYGVSASLIGRPDLGLITLKEMADQAYNIASTISVPLIADADNGYGNELNVARTVELFERAGVAAIQIEDQVSPKKCGHFDNKTVVPFDEAVKKVRAAVRARSNPDTVIIARTDARAVLGIEEALKRCRAFAEEGADVLFFEAPESEDEIRLVARELKGHALMANMVEGGRTPLMPSGELFKLGYRLIIYPITALLSGVNAMQRALANLKEKGISTPENTVMTWRDMSRLIGLEKYKALAERLIADK